MLNLYVFILMGSLIVFGGRQTPPERNKNDLVFYILPQPVRSQFKEKKLAKPDFTRPVTEGCSYIR